MARSAHTYRGVRRNDWKTSKLDGIRLPWHRFWHENFDAKFFQRSYLSKRPSKYMPHDGGKGYIPTPKRQPTDKKTVGQFIHQTFKQMMHAFRTRKKPILPNDVPGRNQNG